MKKRRISCIAIDDEPLALLVISRFCERRGDIDLKTFSEPRVGIEQIRQTKPDLVLLDIEMNSISGLDVAGALPCECCFIFTTAHAQYALDGFDLDAVDFLHKPFAYERFDQAIDKARRRIDARRGHETENLVVKQEYNNISIPYGDILYVEAMGNYVKILRRSGGYVLSRTGINALSEMLPSPQFMRVHRSYIIPLQGVEHFSKREVKITGRAAPIPVGRRYADSTYEILSHMND